MATERSGSMPLLTWQIRKRIALGSARGLAYLHGHNEPNMLDAKIIHRDVKAANVLLNEEFEAVVRVPGIAKLMDYQDSHVVTAQNRFSESNNVEKDKASSLSSGLLCRLFSLAEVQLATHDFDDALIIGKGGFGKVYRGLIDNGKTTVAIKRLNSTSQQGAPEFWTEIQMLSTFRHSHLVSLNSYCNQVHEMILVYEYMALGTFADHLHKGGKMGNPSLSWVQRLKICIGAARGLDYLHTCTGSPQGVIHRDVKSSNILLDENWAAKISDFGLSKFGPVDQSCSHVSTDVKGTHGYLDPAYSLTRRLTTKSDVYAFGVVLLEALCGRPAVDLKLDEEQWGLAGWAQKCIKEDTVDQIIDSTLIRGQILPNSWKAFVQIAEQCLHNRPKQRPKMAEFCCLSAEENLEDLPGQTRRFYLRELQVATDNFSNLNILGRGWSGKVYKGRLSDGSFVAVKRVTERVGALMFRKQVEMISMAVHPNILPLVGYCMTETEQFLVYPFMANGSLASCLREGSGSMRPLTWQIRKRIALGSARGLAYLHGHNEPNMLDAKIIHRDVKAANIFLNEEFEAAVGGFGIAKLMDYQDSHVYSTIRSTPEHIAPEYLSTGKCSEKTDVYGYGFLLLELVTGHRAFDLARLANDDDVMLLGWVKVLWKETKLETLVGAHLQGNYVEEEVKQLIQVSLLCIQDSPMKRPKMSEVVRMLEGDGLAERFNMLEGGVRTLEKMMPEELCRRFSLAEIQTATQDFDDALVIGEGGFGKVYKGVIDNVAITVAIKRLNSLSNQGAPDFWTEIGMLSKFRHCNLVSLIGYCDDSHEMALVYEYMLHGTLDDHLHKLDKSGNAPLSWVQRLKICIGAARGLDYLHTGTSLQHRVIHRDVKSSNILLDENWAAKVSDFGLSKLGPANQSFSHVNTDVKGTLGYLDPEYFLTCQLTRKSDVYAFGVVLFEVLSGRPAVVLFDVYPSVNWAAKVSDFGLSKLGPANQSFSHVNTDVKGTLGYLDPEYFLTCQLTRKSDVYAFGVVLFEVLSGRPAVDPKLTEEQVGLASWAKRCVKGKKLDQIIDPYLKEEQLSSKSLRKFVKIADQCLSRDPEERPTMGEVMFCLEFALKLHLQESKSSSLAEEMTFTRKMQQFFLGTTVTKHVNSDAKPNNKDGVLARELPSGGQTRTPRSKQFTFSELKNITNNFNRERLLGMEPNVVAYKGWIDEKTYNPSGVGIGMAAVVTEVRPNCCPDPELRQILELLRNCSHPNLVKLLGYCTESECSGGKKMFLVLEYKQKESLDNHLFRKGAEPITWPIRLKIAIGAAQGLAFLHTVGKQSMYFKFEASNILLDKDFNAKLSNFGMHELYGAGDPSSFDPSYYAPSGGPKFRRDFRDDVCGFGVVLLQILVCRNLSKKEIPDTRSRHHSPPASPLPLVSSYCVSLHNMSDCDGDGSPSTFSSSSRRFSLADIQSATNNFSDELVVGRGGFGKVYRGSITDGESMTVAVKRLNPRSRQGAREFRTEIEMLSRFRYRYLVSLIGYCEEPDEMILVYEYMPRGNFADHLHRSGKNYSAPLPWLRRLRICTDAARGLDYLHTGTSIQPDRAIHRDVKSSNILLNDNWDAKISDFGLSRLGPEDRTYSHVSTDVKGTRGYLDPDYNLTGRVTRKSDVYAFGVVLLEALCGRPAVDMSADEEQWGLAGWAQYCISERTVDEIIDPSVREEIKKDCLMEFVQIADECLHHFPRKRPTMAQVVVRLEYAVAMQEGKDTSIVVKPAKMPLTLQEGEDSSDVFKPAKMTFTRKVQRFFLGAKSVVCWVKQMKLYVFNLVGTVSFSFGSFKNFRLLISSNVGKNGGYHATEDATERTQTVNILPIAVPAIQVDELKEITDSFGKKALIGEGSCGIVYYGILKSGQAAAIKKFDSSEQPDDEYLAQVSMLSRLKHENVVELLGYSVDGGLRVLVYEYASNGSLHDILHGQKGVKGAQPGPVLSWSQRVKIAVAAAKGLEYLHEKVQPRIVHRNMKSSNVLLFDDDVAKIADLSNQVPDFARVLRTFGYHAPEYALTGQLSSKSDVYGFGVVLLELLTGRIPVDPTLPRGKQSLVTWATRQLSEDKLKQCVDTRLNGEYPPKAVASRRFSLADIQSATDNFADELVISRGGFGKVYKGSITDGEGMTVAVKRLNPRSRQGAREFWTEIEMLSRFRAPLPWLGRHIICIDAAHGLDYLHTGTSIQPDRAIHRDVKSSNILLDDNWDAKISDFGLSRLGLEDQADSHVSTEVKVTFGYLDPEYYLTRRLTRKSDVYAFGVVMLEALCGRPAVDLSRDEEQWGLAVWAQYCIREGRVDEIIDPSVREEINKDCLMEFVQIADECLHYFPTKRPTMAEVVMRLEFTLAMQEGKDSSIVFKPAKSALASQEREDSSDVVKPAKMTFTRKLPSLQLKLLKLLTRPLPLQAAQIIELELYNTAEVQVQ
ncbi:hypothetical protein RJ640_025891, partial [Escallonia rubra]